MSDDANNTVREGIALPPPCAKMEEGTAWIHQRKTGKRYGSAKKGELSSGNRRFRYEYEYELDDDAFQRRLMDAW